MKYPIYPKTKETQRILENFSKMKSNFGLAQRISTKDARIFGRYSTIRKLSKLDIIDITSRKSGKKRSIIYIIPSVSVERKRDNLYYFKI